MINLNKKVQDAIKENLPELVSKELQEYIGGLESDRIALTGLRVTFAEYKEEIEILRALKLKSSEIIAKDCEQQDKQHELDIKEQVLELREKHASERISEIKGLTERVFGSNRLNYNVNLDIPNPNYNQMQPNGCTDYNMNNQLSGTVSKDDSGES